MCSSRITWVRAGEETIWKRHRVCVGEGCESERKRELATDTQREREREREEERGREGSFVSINGV